MFLEKVNNNINVKVWESIPIQVFLKYSWYREVERTIFTSELSNPSGGVNQILGLNKYNKIYIFIKMFNSLDYNMKQLNRQVSILSNRANSLENQLNQIDRYHKVLGGEIQRFNQTIEIQDNEISQIKTYWICIWLLLVFIVVALLWQIEPWATVCYFYYICFVSSKYEFTNIYQHFDLQ